MIKFQSEIWPNLFSEPDVQYAPLFYKPLEIEKDAALKGVCGNFDSEMSFSSEGIDCVK